MSQLTREQQAAALEKDWATNPRWKGIKRHYTAADVVRLRGSLATASRVGTSTLPPMWPHFFTGAS